MGNYAMTVPLPRGLDDQGTGFRELVDLGYKEAWSSEANGTDAFSPLVLGAVHAPELRLGTAIVPAYTRGPALLVQSVATMAAIAPGRFALGVGSSSNVIVESWNGIPFVDPYKKTRDVVRFLKQALTGEKVSVDFETLQVKGFRLGMEPPSAPVPILVAALREGMLRLAGREGDGAIINWLSAEDVKTVSGIVHEQGPEKEIVARIFVCPNPDTETVRAQAKRAIAAYLNVPVYRAFHEWLGRTEVLKEHWRKWDEGDRAGSLEAMPDSVVDELIVHGTPEECRNHIDKYLDNGVTTAALMVMPFGGIDPNQAIKDLAPR
ncbi:MAG: LLM class F420-dependent oxidoreductase [Acidimicrobiales bacterium]|jgi:probable F420-dependent oxidoreductase|nr:LLM class F420-dependent oxidoreductase [Acidimicrobiales bacterium]MDP6297838.1 LLM class F420-dependent oxidoreductase [Acidimicrobiales bacterium]HJM29420.1 LLM class F420-dependent oxidoreductase [Acidimicrobiales bacterium]HJM96888.1 LLM class F420-dependent oxidoreductase [Acidimicrobiales bacterium]